MSTTTRTTTARPTAQPGGRPIGRQIAGGLGALAVLAVGLVGIPAVLAAFVGWPLPHQFPAGSLVTHALGTSIPDSFWPRLFAVLGWLAWAYFTFSVVTTLAAQLRGHRPNRHSRLIPSGAVAALVTAVMVLGQLRGTAISSSSPPVAPLPALQLVAATAPASTPATTAQPTTVTHAVVEGDTLWGIATAYYGDGTRWQAIYLANAGVPQPGGGSLSDAHWIYPGWTLVIPDVTQTAPAPPATPAALPSPAAPAPVVPTTTGANHLAVAQPAPASGGSDAPGSTTPISIVHGVQTHSAPDHGPRHTTSQDGAAPPPAAHTAPAIHPKAAPSTPAGVHAANGTHNASATGHGDDTGALAMGTGIFGLAAIGLVTALDRRRRRQSSRRAPGRRIPLPANHSPLSDLELQLRHYARADSLFWLTRLAEILAHAADGAGTPRPQVLGVHVRHHGLDVLVTPEAGEPPFPFESRPGEPTVWHLAYTTDSDVLVDTAFEDSVVAEPASLTLATVGQGVAGTLLVNLDHYRTVHIHVDPDQIRGTLAAIGTELVGSTASSAAAVVAVGFGHGVIDRLQAGIVTDDLGTALAALRPEEKTVVLLDADAVTAQLVDMAAGTTGLRLVTAGPVAPTGVGLIVDPASATLGGLHHGPVQAAHVADETLADVEALLDLAEAPAEARSEDEPYNQLNMAATQLDALPTAPIILGLLGEPTIAVGDSGPRDLLGAVSPTAGTKARRVVELLVYLAAHDGSASRGQWLTDVSPDKALSDGYIRNLVLLTRRSLEAVTGESDLLAYDRSTQRLTLAESICTDWTMFRSFAASGEPEGLRSALSLVRGAPFGSNPEPWTSAGGLCYVIVDDITDAAAGLGEHTLGFGEPQLATWAARQGQLANRYDQGLWRILLRAASDNNSLQRTRQELCDLLAIDGDPTADLDPGTADLYNALNTAKPLGGEVIVLQDDDDAVIPTRQAV
jgi:hypothetical protein